MKFKKLKTQEHNLDYQDCWAKTDAEGNPALSVWQHSINVGATAAAIVECLPTSMQSIIPEGFIGLAAVHDVGKISPCFQTQSTVWARKYGYSKSLDYCHHSIISEESLISYGIPSVFAEIIGFHHGWRTPPLDTGSAAGGLDWNRIRNNFLRDIEGVIGFLPRQTIQLSLSHKYFLCGLVVLADWIGSSEEFFPLKNSHPIDFDSAKTISKKAIDLLKLFNHQTPKEFHFRQAFGFDPNPLQINFFEFYKAHASIEGGLFILQAPMGIGKTEAGFGALALALKDYKSKGLFFGLPTVLTSNQIFTRLENFLNNQLKNSPNIKRLHSKAILYTQQNQKDPSSPFDAIDWFGHSSKKAFLAPFGVGTIDQALLGILPIKHFFLRLFSLAGKTVILDEVHSYDAYTGNLLNKIIHLLLELKCSIIVMSATLTSHWIEKVIGKSISLSSYPCVHFFSSDTQTVHSQALPPPDSKRIYLDHKILDENTINTFIQDIIDLAYLEHQNIVWICNSVADAQKIYKKLMAENFENGPEIGLLHSRFLPRDRKAIEEKWLNLLGKNNTQRDAGSILVGTQVIEQSIDIDADYLISEISPIDFLIQRAGRLWRHSRPYRPVKYPKMTILTKSDSSCLHEAEDMMAIKKVFGSSFQIYCPYVLLRTVEVLNQYHHFDQPNDIQTLIEQVYKVREERNLIWAELYRTKQEKQSKLENKANILSQLALLPCFGEEEDVIIQTRHQEYETLPLLAVDEIYENQIVINNYRLDTRFKLKPHFIENLQQREILVPAYQLKKIPQEFKKSIFGKNYVVVSTNNKNSWKQRIPDAGLELIYSPEYGLQIEITEEKNEPD